MVDSHYMSPEGESQDNGSTPPLDHPYQFDHTAAALKKLAALEAEIEAAQLAIQEAKHRIDHAKESAQKLASRELHAAYVVDDQAAIELATQLYWFHQDSVNSTTITSVIGASPQNITEFIGAASIKVVCRECGNAYDVIIKSRTALRAARSDHHTCEECQEKARQTRHEEFEAYQQRLTDEYNHLRTMPYTEYLKTDHWQELRTKMLKRAGFRCQVCNAKNVSLHVHHRTYANRGRETYSDLIVLCANCHETFHDNMELEK